MSNDNNITPFVPIFRVGLTSREFPVVLYFGRDEDGFSSEEKDEARLPRGVGSSENPTIGKDRP